MNDAAPGHIAGFLRTAGWHDAKVAPLAGDASNRRFLRVQRGRDRAVLMDAPADRGEDIRPFLAITDWLRTAGLSAPEILAVDVKTGLLLIEDLGDDLFARWLMDRPADTGTLYCAAVDLLADLAQIPSPAGLAPYDVDIYVRESALVLDWWMPLTGAAPSPELRADGCALFAEVFGKRDPAPPVCVLRDYHAENLLWLPERSSARRVGLLDYQDALVGSPAYDLVSLLEDARRDTSPDLRAAMIDRYLARRPDLDPVAFRATYARLGAQRNLKIVGIFARLAHRDGKPGYLDLVPRVWSHLQRDLADAALGPLAAWVAAHIPAPTPETLARARRAA